MTDHELQNTQQLGLVGRYGKLGQAWGWSETQRGEHSSHNDDLRPAPSNAVTAIHMCLLST